LINKLNLKPFISNSFELSAFKLKTYILGFRHTTINFKDKNFGERVAENFRGSCSAAYLKDNLMFLSTRTFC